ncbi:unnamed protein product, partial [Acanthoscelides obtectus]
FNLSILFESFKVRCLYCNIGRLASNSNYALLGSLRAQLKQFHMNLAETNRTPLDFVEGESELVSGFNVEYRRGGFAIIFFAEYRRILFISIICCILFFGRDIFTILFF